MDHHHVDDGFTSFWQELIVFTQPAVTGEPPQRALHNPPFRQEKKAFGPLRPLDNLEADFPPGPQRPHPRQQLPSVRTISPNEPYPGESMPEALQQQLCPVAVWHTGSRDHHRQDQAEGIDDEVAFATFDLLARVIAPDPPVSVVLTD